MEIYRVAFIGHRDIDNIKEIEYRIEEIAKHLICQHEYVEFYIGRNGDFDISVASSIKRVQKALGASNSTLTLVLPYNVRDEYFLRKFYDDLCYPLDPKTHYKSAITKRNKWMVDNSDLLICFVKQGQSGGALTTFKYAHKQGIEVINLAAQNI